MRFSPTLLLSQLRLARRGAVSWRFYAVSALNPTEEQQVNHLEVPKIDPNLSQAGVLGVLNGVSDDPERAFSFLSQLKQNGIPLNVNAYATVVTILANWGLDRKLDSVLVELIKNEKKRSFSVMDLIEAIGEEVEEKERSLLLGRVSSALVKAYVSLGMFDEVSDVLIQSKRLGCVPSIKSCNFLMNRWIEVGENDRAVSLFRQLKQFGLCANRYTYAIAVKALCRKGDLDKAFQLLGESPSAFGYTAYIEGLCVNGWTGDAMALIKDLVDMKVLSGDDLRAACCTAVRGFCNEMNIAAAETVVLTMGKLGIAPHAYACSLIIDWHCKKMDISKAMGFLDKMLDRGLKLNCVIVTSILQCYCKMEKYVEVLEKFVEYGEFNIYLDRVCYNVAFDALSKLGRVEEAVELLQEMMDKGMVPDLINYTTLIEGYFIQGKFVDALNLFDKMRENGTSPDVIMYNVLAGGFARNGHDDYALEIYETMKAEGLKPSAVTHSVIIEGLCFARKIQEAEKFFRSLENKCLENYVSLVKGYCESGLSKKAFKLFTYIEKPLRKSAYFKLFTSLCNDRYLDKAHIVLKTMCAYGVEPGSSMYGKLIGAFCQLNKDEEAKHLFDEMVGRGLIPDVFTYTIMIHRYCRLNELQKAYALFEDMKRREIEPDVVTYTVLFDSYPKHKIKDSVQGNVLKSKVSEVWKEFCNSNIEPDVVCYTVFVDRQFKVHNLEGAEEHLNEMIKSGLKPDTVTYTALLSGYCRNGYIDKAATFALELEKEAIAPPGHFEAVVMRACAIMKSKRFRFRE